MGCPQSLAVPTWTHLCSGAGGLPFPNGGTQQTACVVFDVDGDGVDDIVIAERTQAPAIVWLRRTPTGWDKYLIDDSRQRPEAGGIAFDVDGDGDLDLIIGGDYRSDELWWYENPAPDFDPRRPWRRHLIRKGGGTAFHDQVVADFTGAGRPQLAFWNQGSKRLYLAEIPAAPRGLDGWPCVEIFSYDHLQGGLKQEGMCAFDIDGDGKVDLLAGQYWFRHLEGYRFEPVCISDRPGRVRAGRFKPGPCAQIVHSSGDGDGPLALFECVDNPRDAGAWRSRRLLDRDVLSGHTLEVGDINGDGHLDIFCAEMHTPGPREHCTAWILYGDGRGSFQLETLAVGVGNHDSRLADLTGSGRLDIVGKPYTWDTPRLDVWLNNGI